MIPAAFSTLSLQGYPAARVLAVAAMAFSLWFACTPAHSAGKAASLPSPNVAWIPAGGDADIERCFAKAKSENKPLLLYWGAAWCPPCNQLKVTLFNRQDFAAQAKSLVAVNLDGDRAGAQKLGARFKVVGYPTVILFSPDGAEITRLPGEVEGNKLMALLQSGIAGGRPAKAILADARSGKSLTGSEWRSLAFYAWDIDEAQLVGKDDRAALLAQLAARSPASEADTSMRLWLKALAASKDGKNVKADKAVRDRILTVITDPLLAREQMDVLVNFAPEIVRALAFESKEKRAAWSQGFDAALAQLQRDPTLSRSDQVSALTARVDLARLDLPKDAVKVELAQPLLGDVRKMATRMDREINNSYERQAVITNVADMLAQAGLWAESDRLLKANLAKSHSPYYLMSQLGGNARKLGNNGDALRWYGEAFNKSKGPATRLQWGANYLAALVDLAPQDAPRIEQAASQILAEAANDKTAFYERSARSLKKVGDKLALWNDGGKHDPEIRRLQDKLAVTCAKIPAADPQRATCEGLLRTAPGKA